MLFTGNITALIERTDCTNSRFLCVSLEPAEAASYSLYEGVQHISCVDITNNTLCNGKDIK